MGRYGRPKPNDEHLFDTDTPYAVDKNSSTWTMVPLAAEPTLIEKFSSKLPFMGKMKKNVATEAPSRMNGAMPVRQLPRAPVRDRYERTGSLASLDARKNESKEDLAANSFLSNADGELKPLRSELVKMREQVQQFRDELSSLRHGHDVSHHKSLARVCVCGNKFLEDALFCRKCGAKRPEVKCSICDDTGKDTAGQICNCLSGNQFRDELASKLAQAYDHNGLYLQGQSALPVESSLVAGANTVPRTRKDDGILAELWNILGCSGDTEAVEQPHSYGWHHQNQPVQPPRPAPTTAAPGLQAWDAAAARQPWQGIAYEGGSSVSGSTQHEPEEEHSPNRWPTTCPTCLASLPKPSSVQLGTGLSMEAVAGTAPAPRSPSIASIDAPSRETPSTSSPWRQHPETEKQYQSPWRAHPETGNLYEVPFPDLSDED